MTPRKSSRAPAERTPAVPLSESALRSIVGYQLAQATIVTDKVFEERAGHRGVRRIEFAVLALVQANADVSARHLARALAVTPPNIAICLDRLESRGLVVRRRSTADARVQHIRLSAAGSTLVDRLAEQIRQGEQEALAPLSPAEQAMLVELLHKVALVRRGG
jgi:DNA-binding MarR family transcriptional regulator